MTTSEAGPNPAQHFCHIHPTHRTQGRTSGLDVVTVMVCPALNQVIQTALVGVQSPERVIMPAPVDRN